MNNINERLDKLRKLVQEDDFLEGKGLSNEVNIRIFCYEPAEEMRIKHFVKQITTDQSIKSHIVEYDLYRIFLDICADLDILDGISDMEECDGSEFTIGEIQSTVGVNDFINKIKEYGSLKFGDVMFITGVGDVFPFMRIHLLLEALQPHFSTTPILVMYPGTFDGKYVRLFDKLTPNPYYRTFNVV